LSIESQILSRLIYDETYARAILPFLERDYFSSDSTQNVFELIKAFETKYDRMPTSSALIVDAETKGYDEKAYDDVIATINNLEKDIVTDRQWLIDKTEEYCKQRALQNAIEQSILILNDENQPRGKIQDLVESALQVDFTTKLGHEYFNNAEQRYDYLHDKTPRIPFDLETFNRATKGGLKPKTLNLILAGCINPKSIIRVKYTYKGVPRVKEMTAGRARELHGEGIDLFVDSPNGYVRIQEWVDKGTYQQYLVGSESGYVLSCNKDHLVMTPSGWERVELLEKLNAEGQHVLTRRGFERANIMKTDVMVPIIDLVVDHESHSYYADGIVSHNTNVGKTLMMCHMTAASVLAGKNVLYITLEISEEEIGARIDANLLDISLEQQESMPKDWFLKRVKQIKEKCGGSFFVKEYPSGSAHVGHIRHLIKELRLKHGFIPDIIFVDYLTIMASQRVKLSNTARHSYFQAIAQELRALGQTEGPRDANGKVVGVPVVSAGQLNREGFGDSDADMTQVAGSWDLTGDCDWLIVVSQPEDMIELGQYLVKQDKSRYADKNKMRKFCIGVDMSKQKLYDLDVQPKLNDYDSVVSEKLREKEADDIEDNPWRGVT
jgi:replicative DNA helicase